jgi:hypothetical protein
MRNLVVMVMLLVFAGAVQAQAQTSGNVFFGYSYYNTNLSTVNRASANGWEATLEGKVLPVVGIVADIDAHYGTQDFPGFSADFTERNFLFGPRFSVPTGKIRPFAQVEVGVGHVSIDGGPSDTCFATDLGGGIDYKLIPHAAWRFQGDYLSTRFFSTTQNNFRFSTGIVVRF